MVFGKRVAGFPKEERFELNMIPSVETSLVKVTTSNLHVENNVVKITLKSVIMHLQIRV